MHTREVRIARQVEVAVEQILDRHVKEMTAALVCFALRGTGETP